MNEKNKNYMDAENLEQIKVTLEDINRNLLYLITLIELDHPLPEVRKHGETFAHIVRVPGFINHSKPSKPVPKSSGGRDE